MSKREGFLRAAASAKHDDCLIWPFAVRASSGYGAHSLPLGARDVKLNVDSHVRACTLAHGERPTPEYEATHSCGHKLCCNGGHLRWATHAENMADAIAHGARKGGGRSRQRLFVEEVAMVRDSTDSLVELGRALKMEPAYLGHVRREARRLELAA